MLSDCFGFENYRNTASTPTKSSKKNPSGDRSKQEEFLLHPQRPKKVKIFIVGHPVMLSGGHKQINSEESQARLPTLLSRR